MLRLKPEFLWHVYQRKGWDATLGGCQMPTVLGNSEPRTKKRGQEPYLAILLAPASRANMNWLDSNGQSITSFFLSCGTQ